MLEQTTRRGPRLRLEGFSMSMILGLTTLGDINIDRILENPPLIWKVIYPDEPELHDPVVRPAVGGGFLSRLFGRAARKAETPPTPVDFELGSGEGRTIDLDKAWHGIHFLLAGRAWEGDFPQGFLVAGGSEVGDVDVGYGPARVFKSTAVATVSTFLAEIDGVDFSGRYDPGRMIKADIYPDIWGREEDADGNRAYLADYFDILRRFMSQAAEEKMGIVLHLN